MGRIEGSLENKGITLGAFLVIEGGCDNTSFLSIERAARYKYFNDTIIRWITYMLSNRTVRMHMGLAGEKLRTAIKTGCPQGGALSHLLWNQLQS